MTKFLCSVSAYFYFFESKVPLIHSIIVALVQVYAWCGMNERNLIHLSSVLWCNFISNCNTTLPGRVLMRARIKNFRDISAIPETTGLKINTFCISIFNKYTHTYIHTHMIVKLCDLICFYLKVEIIKWFMIILTFH